MKPFFVSGEIDLTPFSFALDIRAMTDTKAGVVRVETRVESAYGVSA